MDLQKRSLRMGAWVLGLALLIKLGSQLLPTLFPRDGFAATVLFLETGRTPKAPTQPQTSTVPAVTDPPEIVPAPPVQTVPVFSPGDSDLISISPLQGYRVDVQAMLETPLRWQLRQESPTVLILHTHATESYTATQAEPYTASSPYRTLDEDHNMLRVGDRLQELLEDAGIHVIHDKTLHDYPDFNSAYTASRKTAQNYLAQYPSIRLVLDLHRDAADLSANTQLNTAATVDGKPSAQLMFVIGTDGTGLSHPNWQENMSLAVKLQATLEKAHPGICRAVNFRAQRFNQDLSPGAMIVEVGAAGDTLEEALVATEALAQSIITLASGVPAEDSAS